MLERIKCVSSEADLEECKQEYERQKRAQKRRQMCAEAEVRLDMMLSRHYVSDSIWKFLCCVKRALPV